MKILYCNPCFWDYRIPFFAEINRLFRGNFHILYSTKRYFGNHRKVLPKIEKAMGENAHPYDNEWFYVRETHSMTIKNETYRAIPLSFGLIPLIKKINPSVIITEGFFQWTPIIQLYSIFHKIPVFVGYERTLHTERKNGKLKTFIRKCQDRFITGYLVNGIETKKYLESIGIISEKIYIAGMSADSDGLRESIKNFPPSDRDILRRKYINTEGILFLFTGQMILRKGVNHLLASWKLHTKRYPKDALVLVGSGEMLDKWKQEYNDDQSIYFVGSVDYSEIHKFYSIADVYILPTIEDNWSLVIPEAMSCGLPVATSIYNGCHPELVHEGENGIVFDTFQQESLLNALEYFHHIDLKQHGIRSIEIEKEYNTENAALKFYSAILDNLNKKIAR